MIAHAGHSRGIRNLRARGRAPQPPRWPVRPSTDRPDRRPPRSIVPDHPARTRPAMIRTDGPGGRQRGIRDVGGKDVDPLPQDEAGERIARKRHRRA